MHLTDDQKAFVRQAVETGRYAREEDAVREAMTLWEERERTRAEVLAAEECRAGATARIAVRATQCAGIQIGNAIKVDGQRVRVGRRRLGAKVN